MRGFLIQTSLARRLRVSVLRRQSRRRAEKLGIHLRVLWLRSSDFDHGGHGDAPHAAAADGVVLGRTFDGDTFQRHVGAAVGGSLGLTYRTAWLLAQKLRRSMVDPDRELLEGVVEVDQAEIPFREGDTFSSPATPAKSSSSALSR